MRLSAKRVACASEGMSKYNNQPMPLSSICYQRKINERFLLMSSCAISFLSSLEKVSYLKTRTESYPLANLFGSEHLLALE